MNPIKPLSSSEGATVWVNAMNRVLGYQKYLYVSTPVLINNKKSYEVDDDHAELNYEASGLIITSVAPHIMILIQNMKSSKEMWDYLIDSYVKRSFLTNHHRLFLLFQDLGNEFESARATLLQETSYLNPISNYNDFVLARLLFMISKDQKLSPQVLPSLLSDETLKIDNISAKMKAFQISHSTGKIGTQDKQIVIASNDVHQDTNSPIVNTATVICSNCKKSGHTIKKCFRYCKFCKTDKHWTRKCNKGTSNYPELISTATVEVHI